MPAIVFPASLRLSFALSDKKLSLSSSDSDAEALGACSTLSSSAEEDNVEQAPKASASESDEDNESFLSDKAKDNLKDAGKTMAGIYRDGKEVVSELSGTMNEIKGLFKFK